MYIAQSMQAFYLSKIFKMLDNDSTKCEYKILFVLN